MPHDANAWVIGEDALQPLAHLGRTVGDNDLAGVKRVADANAATVMKGHPARAAGHVQQGVEDGPVAHGIAAVEHGFRFAKW